MSLKVGITGGIGVGKTVCCKIFEILNVPVFYADKRAKLIMQNDAGVKLKILKAFGEKSYTSNGELNRSYLSGKVFSNSENTKLINRIVHPAVGVVLKQWFQNVTTPYAIYEAALMFESGSNQFLDKIIVVDAPLDLRVERVINRDDVDPEEVHNRISKQIPQLKKINQADYVIRNDGSQSVLKQILEIHLNLMRCSIDA